MCETTSFTPARLVYGRELRSFYELASSVQHSDLSPFDPLEYDGKIQGDLDRIHKLAYESARRAREAQSRTYNLRHRPLSFLVGDLVYYKNFPQSSGSNKVTSKFCEKFRDDL